MAGKGTDRKVKGKDQKATNELAEILANFSLPHSLPCSEVDFPVIIKRRAKAKWKDIVDESDTFYHELNEYQESKNAPGIKAPFLKTECEYIKNEIFTQLIPVLEETLLKAKKWNAFHKPKCFFNGIDHIAQVLWSNNPRDPTRKPRNLHLFNMPWVKKILLENPRPYYPKSWLWPPEYAATVIQTAVRQYFVQKQDDVQEMREFWKKLDLERREPDIVKNPLLAKKFASTSQVDGQKLTEDRPKKNTYRRTRQENP